MVIKYDETSIDVNVSDAQKIRASPQVYINTPDNAGRLLIVKEPIQNSFDEAILKEVKNKNIIVCLEGDSVWVSDAGRGIPVGKHAKTGISTLTTVLTTLSAGGKMRTADKSGYSKATSGIHGMGVSITNAMSNYFECWTFRDKWYNQTFAKGKPTSKVIISKAPKLPFVGSKLQPKCGTTIKFIADLSVFNKGAELELSALKSFLDISSYLVPHARIILATKKKIIEYYQPKGLVAYLDKRISKLQATPLGKVFEYQGKDFDLVAMCWIDNDEEHISSFVNSVPTPEHGTHVNGLNQTIMDVLSPLKLKKHEFRSEDLRTGLLAVFNVRLNQPQFTTQNKIKLATPEITETIKSELKPVLTKFFDANKTLYRAIIDRAHQMAEAKAEFKLNRKAGNCASSEQKR